MLLFRSSHEFQNPSFVFLQFLNYTCQIIYFRHFRYTCLSYKCIITRLIVAFLVCMFSFKLSSIYRNSDSQLIYRIHWEQHNTELDQGLVYPIVPELLAEQVVSSLCGQFQFSDHVSMPLYLQKGILGPLDGAYTLESTFSSCGFIIGYQQLPQFSQTLYIDHLLVYAVLSFSML